MIKLLRRKRLNWQQISAPQTKTKYRRKQLPAKNIKNVMLFLRRKNFDSFGNFICLRYSM